MVKLLCLLLISLLIIHPVSAQTNEAGYFQEFDITFWQTAPFAIFWVYNLEGWLAVAGHPHWEVILAVSAVISVANAALRAKDVVNSEGTGDHH